jgi:hypothetical protein
MPPTHRRLIGVLVVFIGIILTTSCANAASSPDASPVASEKGASATNLAGTWVSSEQPGFEAVITPDQITVYFVDGETKSLFWKGTFPETATESEIVSSAGDVDAMASSLLGSTETIKPFTFTGEEITFEFSMMGTSTIVHTAKK